jgi:hypothetical protein
VLDDDETELLWDQGPHQALHAITTIEGSALSSLRNDDDLFSLITGNLFQLFSHVLNLVFMPQECLVQPRI